MIFFFIFLHFTSAIGNGVPETRQAVDFSFFENPPKRKGKKLEQGPDPQFHFSMQVWFVKWWATLIKNPAFDEIRENCLNYDAYPCRW